MVIVLHNRYRGSNRDRHWLNNIPIRLSNDSNSCLQYICRCVQQYPSTSTIDYWAFCHNRILCKHFECREVVCVNGHCCRSPMFADAANNEYPTVPMATPTTYYLATQGRLLGVFQQETMALIYWIACQWNIDGHCRRPRFVLCCMCA